MARASGGRALVGLLVVLFLLAVVGSIVAALLGSSISTKKGSTGEGSDDQAPAAEGSASSPVEAVTEAASSAWDTLTRKAGAAWDAVESAWNGDDTEGCDPDSDPYGTCPSE